MPGLWGVGHFRTDEGRQERRRRDVEKYVPHKRQTPVVCVCGGRDGVNDGSKRSCDEHARVFDGVTGVGDGTDRVYDEADCLYDEADRLCDETNRARDGTNRVYGEADCVCDGADHVL